MTVLGIESSCDETSAAICREGKIINNVIATQAVHKTYGGVVPELASRAHLQNIIPVVEQALSSAKLSKKEIDAIAYTQGPGLLGALLVGSSMARTMAMTLGIPVIPVHHMKAHVLAHFIGENHPVFPFLCLTVSGGHTQIVRVDSYAQMTVLGQTIDDAVGEAFDKCAKMLGLPYPGGPLVDKYAQQGNPNSFSFSKSEIPDLNYSFSGIKTSVLYFLRKQKATDEDFISKNLEDLCASIQRTLMEMLMEKFLKAAKNENIKHLAIAGGVAANSGLRQALQGLEEEGYKVYIPDFEYCTDNAGMIAMSGYLLAGDKAAYGKISDSPKPRMAFNA